MCIFYLHSVNPLLDLLPVLLFLSHTNTHMHSERGPDAQGRHSAAQVCKCVGGGEFTFRSFPDIPESLLIGRCQPHALAFSFCSATAWIFLGWVLIQVLSDVGEGRGAVEELNKTRGGV